MRPVADEVRRRLVSQTTQLWGEPGVTDLGIGQPQDELLPVAHVADAMRTVAAQGLSYPLQYGIERGDGHLRVALADFLAPRYGVDVDPQRLLVSNGNSQAIDWCCAVFARPGDVVLVEDPTYFLALDIFRGHGLRVVGVPLHPDGAGFDLAALAAAIREHRPAFVYTVPTAHNPTGATMPADRRDRLVALAAEHGTLVVADEVYHLLCYGSAEPSKDPGTAGPPPLAAWIDSGVVLSLGTFSKILAPGLRLGWVQGSPDLLARLERHGTLASGGGLNPFASPIVATLLEDGTAAGYLTWLHQVFRERIAVLDAALRAAFPPEASAAWQLPTAGYFFWLRFPDGVDTAAVRPRAVALGAAFAPGPRFSTSGSFTNCLRLSFAYYPTADLTRAVTAIARAFSEHARLHP